jgi:serine/threonine-protein phosphatase 6 regulatory subunit 3
MTRITNKLIQLGSSNGTIQIHLQENSEWVDWQTDVLVKRNEVENVYHWACGYVTVSFFDCMLNLHVLLLFFH